MYHQYLSSPRSFESPMLQTSGLLVNSDGYTVVAILMFFFPDTEIYRYLIRLRSAFFFRQENPPIPHGQRRD